MIATKAAAGPGAEARETLAALVEQSARHAADFVDTPTRFWASPAAQAALRTLCEEVRLALSAGEVPPCLAVAPEAGTAVLFGNWAGGGVEEGGTATGGTATGGTRLTPEWSNVHVACPAYRVAKLTVQSFREIAVDSPNHIHI